MDSSYDSMKNLPKVEIRRGFIPQRHWIKTEEETNFFIDAYKQESLLASTNNTNNSLMSGKNPFAIAFNEFTKR
jgi:hypothetical protein